MPERDKDVLVFIPRKQHLLTRTTTAWAVELWMHLPGPAQFLHPFV